MQTPLRHQLEVLLSRKEALLTQAQSECDNLHRSCNAIRNALHFIEQEGEDTQSSKR